MSKLTKISLALLIALFITSSVEAIYIFVYKPTQSAPPPPSSISEIVPSPVNEPLNPPIVNSSFIDDFKTWGFHSNLTVNATYNLTGTISAVMVSNDPNQTNTIEFQKTADKDLGGLAFFNKTDNPVKVYKQDSSGNLMLGKLNDLSIGDYITISQIYDASKHQSLANAKIVIYLLKQHETK